MSSDLSARSRPWLTVEQEVTDLLARVDSQSFRTVVQAFENKDRRWFFSGQGRSGLVAQMAAMRFMHVGYEAHFVGEVTAPSVRKGDGFVLVCGSGQTPISMGFAAVAKSEGALLVVLTHKPQSKLAGVADIVLPVPMENTSNSAGACSNNAASYCSIALFSSSLGTTPTPSD